MEHFIPLSVPNLKGKELEYVSNAVKTEWVSTGGPYVNQFEEKIAEYLYVKGAVSCQNGTAGIHTALLVLKVNRGDEVIVPTLTFIAAVNPVNYIGAEPVFMDCDDSLCMDPRKLYKFCTEECDFVEGHLLNKLTSKIIKAIIVVHVFGNMANMEEITKIAKEFNLAIIEDATEAIGTYYTEGKFKGKYAGTIGDVGVFSFNGNKIITTGGGGMIVSNDEYILDHSKHLTTQAKSDELFYTHDEVGYNYRMTNLQAALGLAQLEQLEKFIEIKLSNYDKYKHALTNVAGLIMIDFVKVARSNKWFYSLIIDDKEYGIGRDDLIVKLNEKGIQSRPIWGLIHQQMPYKDKQSYKIEKASYYIEKVLNIPCSTNLSEADVDYVISIIKSLKKSGEI
ncbi:LegC family aminotransferase [Fusibacter sp. 3D3]|uniref:LegC family aminotransferase n=1 Tax=Fusibacter sp. 3D3 TaxID=1048380 RepID=UPI000853AD51|nr:LegC family aminotransferase [Fusibacter sp. 3D3]GAU77778.1 bacillosamine/legionaminic acid biosynthesis aminotransferase PglE [Fusibacter sp. 3D3]